MPPVIVPKAGPFNLQLQDHQFVISNTASGGPLDPEKLFQRFSKGGQTTDQHGLGLSIVQQIGEVSGKRISYHFDKGTSIFLPYVFDLASAGLNKDERLSVVLCNYQMALVTVSRLTKKFRTHLAVDDLSFSVNEGDVYGFLGQNGAGKSTTIRMLLTLVTPTAGHIEMFGLDLKKRKKKNPQSGGCRD